MRWLKVDTLEATYYEHFQSLQVHCIYFPLFLQILLFQALLQLSLNNILFDMSTFSSCLKLCNTFDVISTSNLLETVLHGVISLYQSYVDLVKKSILELL